MAFLLALPWIKEAFAPKVRTFAKGANAGVEGGGHSSPHPLRSNEGSQKVLIKACARCYEALYDLTRPFKALSLASGKKSD